MWQYFTGDFKVVMEPDTALALEQSFEDPATKDVVSKSFSNSIAASLPGVSPESVDILKIYLVRDRRLVVAPQGEPSHARRLQGGARLQVDYVIIMDELVVSSLGMDPTTVASGLGANVGSALNTELAAAAADLGIPALSSGAVQGVVDVTVPATYTATVLQLPGTITTTRSTTTITSTTTTTTTTTSTTTSSTTTTTIPPYDDEVDSNRPRAAFMNILFLGIGLFCLAACCFRKCYMIFRSPRYGEADIGDIGGKNGWKAVSAQWTRRRKKWSAKPVVEWDVNVDAIGSLYREEFAKAAMEDERSHMSGGTSPFADPDAEHSDLESQSRAPTDTHSEGGASNASKASPQRLARTARAANPDFANSMAFNVVVDPNSSPVAHRLESKWNKPEEEEEAFDNALLDEEEIANAPVVPMYEDGVAAEYYSRTHKRWLAGRVFVTTVPGTLFKEPEVTYNVVVKTGARSQRREDVQLSLLRPRFQTGEVVEVFSAKRGQKWLTATIVGSPNSLGLDLELEEDGTLFKQVPNTKVRKCFLDGDQVEVYRGPGIGFLGGEVDHATARGGAGGVRLDFGAEVASNAGSCAASEMSMDSFGGSVTGPNGSLFSAGSDKAGSDAGSVTSADVDVGFTMVPVRFDEDTHAQWVPSYLVVHVPLAEL